MKKKTWVPPTVAPLSAAKDAQAQLIGTVSDGTNNRKQIKLGS
ncbi:MAG TPA: hypothetical protein VNS46_14655 [Nocardioides sp.]|nr:hypothetical protein [Nocardioides sp.]